ncbi:MAG: CHASE domain-containing protein [Thermoguttaceae bacterium]
MAKPEGSRFHRLSYKQWWLLGGVAVGGLVVSFVLFWTIRLQERQVAGVQFRLEAEKKVAAVKQALANQLGVVSLVKAFYAGSFEVDRNELKIFSDSVFEEHSDIKTLAWMPRVRSEQRGAFEEAVKKSGFPQFQITQRRGDVFVPATVRKQYFPILFIEPQTRHQDMLGFDLGSLPECIAAMDWAETRLGPAITYANIPGLKTESEFTIYMFEGAQNEVHSSAEVANPSPLADGFILGMFHIRDVVSSALELIQPTGVDIYLFDVTDPQKTNPIFSYPSRIRETALPVLESPLPESSAPIHYEERISVANCTWLAYCLPTDVYFRGKTGWEPPAALLAGLLITGLMAGYLVLLTGRTARIEKLVSQRTRELQVSERRFQLLVENAADAFFLINDNGRIFDVNQRSCELLGYSREELLKMNVMDFEVGFKPEEHHELTWKRPTADFPINVDGLHRRKDGGTYPVEVRLNCLETAGNRLLMAVVRDVTEHKQAEAAIRKEQRFLRHLIDLQERERKLMAYEIHDGLAQQLTGALFKLQSLETTHENKDLPASRKILDDVLQLIRESVAEARRLIGGLRPPILDESGIVAAVEDLCADRRHGDKSQIEFVNQAQFRRLAAPLEVALFRIVQECLTNASRHSQSPKIRVELSQLENRVRLTVQDWGVGFDPHEVKGERFGLRGIRERVRLLGGTADINSAPGKGTTVIVELPLLEGDIDEDDNNSNG